MTSFIVITSFIFTTLFFQVENKNDIFWIRKVKNTKKA